MTDKNIATAKKVQKDGLESHSIEEFINDPSRITPEAFSEIADPKKTLLEITANTKETSYRDLVRHVNLLPDDQNKITINGEEYSFGFYQSDKEFLPVLYNDSHMSLIQDMQKEIQEELSRMDLDKTVRTPEPDMTTPTGPEATVPEASPYLHTEKIADMMTIETAPNVVVLPEVREAAIEKAKELFDELDLDPDGTGDVNIRFDNDVSRIEFQNEEYRQPLIFFDTRDFSRNAMAVGEYNRGWDDIKAEIRQIDRDKKIEHIPVEGADSRRPGAALEEVMQKERADEIQEIMAADMDPAKASDNVVKEEIKKAEDPDRKELKKEIADLKKEIDGLADRVVHETSIMKAQGGDPKECERINSLTKKIGDKTIELAMAQQELRKDTAMAVITAPARGTKALAHKISDLGRKMVRSGKEAIAKTIDRVHLANKRATENVKGAYTSVMHDVTQIHRNWKHLNYTFEKAQVHAINSLQKHLVKSYVKNAERSAAAKNIGSNLKSFFTGRRAESVKAETGLTEKQYAIIASLEKHKESINKDAEKYFADYSISAERDMSRINARTESRENLGMKEHRTLAGDIKMIHEQMKKDAENRSKDPMSRDIGKESKEKDNGLEK